MFPIALMSSKRDIHFPYVMPTLLLAGIAFLSASFIFSYSTRGLDDAPMGPFEDISLLREGGFGVVRFAECGTSKRASCDPSSRNPNGRVAARGHVKAIDPYSIFAEKRSGCKGGLYTSTS